MCGRFALPIPKPSIEKYLNIHIPFDLPLRYNIAPTDDTLVICTEDKLPQMMHWGFLPFWAKDQKITEQINAKCETIHQKPMFRNAFKERRCLVVSGGFFEWQKVEVASKIIKKPFYITYKDATPMLFAGIWDRCEKEKGTQVGFTILTTAANNLVKKYHARMPVIIPLQQIGTWLSNASTEKALFNIFEPIATEELIALPVSPVVNSPKNDNALCITKLNE